VTGAGSIRIPNDAPQHRHRWTSGTAK